MAPADSSLKVACSKVSSVFSIRVLLQKIELFYLYLEVAKYPPLLRTPLRKNC
jgi:hypothetical protein